MNAFRFRLLVAALAVVFGSAIARSQTTNDAPTPPPMHRHFGMEGHEMGFFAKQLNLTDEQQAQMKTIMESAHTSMKPLREQSRQINQQLHQYAMGTYEDAPVQKLAQQKALIDAQLTVAQTKAHNQMFQLLTPDQQAKAKEMVANHEARMEQHMHQHMHQTPPPPAEQ